MLEDPDTFMIDIPDSNCVILQNILSFKFSATVLTSNFGSLYLLNVFANPIYHALYKTSNKLQLITYTIYQYIHDTGVQYTIIK